MSTLSENQLLTFRAISNFVNELNAIFSTQHSLRLYGRLINKTMFVHIGPIEKHIDAFRIFCISNRQSILDRNFITMECNNVQYSEKVYINIKALLELNNENDAIWTHLLTISAIIDPTSRAKEVLKEIRNNQSDSKNETEFITNIINQVETHIPVNSTNPMDAISSIMQSGIFTDLVSGMNNGLNSGNLDITRLMSTVQTMVSTMGGTDASTASNPMMNPMMTTMMSTMISSMGSSLPQTTVLEPTQENNKQVYDMSQ